MKRDVPNNRESSLFENEYCNEYIMKLYEKGYTELACQFLKLQYQITCKFNIPILDLNETGRELDVDKSFYDRFWKFY